MSLREYNTRRHHRSGANDADVILQTPGVLITDRRKRIGETSIKPVTIRDTRRSVGGISAVGEKPAQTPCGLSNLTSQGPAPVKQQLIRKKEAEAAGRRLLVEPDAAKKIMLTSGIPIPSQIAAMSSDPKGVACIRWQPPS